MKKINSKKNIFRPIIKFFDRCIITPITKFILFVGDCLKSNDKGIERVLNNLQFIKKNMHEVSVEILKENEILLDSMLFRLIQIQEDIKKLSIEFKMKYDSIPWFQISGIRNRIVHDYGNIDLRVVYKSLTGDVDLLINIFSSIKI